MAKIDVSEAEFADMIICLRCAKGVIDIRMTEGNVEYAENMILRVSNILKRLASQ